MCGLVVRKAAKEAKKQESEKWSRLRAAQSRDRPDIFLSFLKIYLFIYLFLAALGLCCGLRAFSSCSKWRLLFVAVHGLLTAVASLVAEHGLWARGLQ